MDTANKKYDIAAVGECLIDMTAAAAEDVPAVELRGNPGGAPANVLAAASLLGMRTAFIGKAGKDIFGDVIARALSGCGIDISGLVRADEPTTLAIVSLDERGERSFSFYRNGTADVMLTPGGTDLSIVANARIFHFGSVSMTSEPAASATLKAAEAAAGAGARVSFDPNLRIPLWDDPGRARDLILRGMAMADYVKVNDEELYFCTGQEDVLSAGRSLLDRFGLSFLAVTLGERGCVCFTPGHTVSRNGLNVHCADSTGAGDAFWGAALSFILSGDTPPERYDASRLEELAAYANAAGALSVGKPGAIPSLPSKEELAAFAKLTL